MDRACESSEPQPLQARRMTVSTVEDLALQPAVAEGDFVADPAIPNSFPSEALSAGCGTSSFAAEPGSRSVCRSLRFCSWRSTRDPQNRCGTSINPSI